MDIQTFPPVSTYRRVRTFLRYWALRALGYRIVNRWSHLWWLRPARTTAKALDKIRAELGLKDFGIALEYGCHNGRLSGAIASVSKEVWGIDISDRCPYPLDRYVKVTELEPGCDNYIPSIADSSVDTVMVLNIVAFEPNDHWEDEVHKQDDLLARYLTPGNFPRVLKTGGHLVWMDHEFGPEKRVGRITHEELTARISDFYRPMPLEGFQLVRQGFSMDHSGPYVVYRRL